MKIYEILDTLPEKNLKHKSTTSLRWKRELIDFFIDKNLDKCLELGTHHGHTTRVLSELFKHVYTIEHQNELINSAKELCKDCNNIQFIHGDAYLDETYYNLPNSFNVVVIDCIHKMDEVLEDIQRSLNYFDEQTGIYIVFDDHGHPESKGVKSAVDHAINEGLKVEKYIGEDPGFTVTRTNGSSFTLIHKEGVILSHGI
jgi:predicted O-methyltransferase YrrM